MLSDDRVRELQESLRPLSEFADRQLVRRPEAWGAIHFEHASEDIDSVISIAKDLLNLPIKLLTEVSGQELLNYIPPVLQCLREIDGFSIENVDSPRSGPQNSDRCVRWSLR